MRDPEDDSPEQTSDDRDVGWGEDLRESERSDDWYEAERPPHHGT